MHIEAKDRAQVKLECLRMILTLRLDLARSQIISAFMTSYLTLTAAETVVYNQEVAAMNPAERKAVMRWTNEWKEQGKAEGVQVGERRGEERLLLRQLRGRFGKDVDPLAEPLSKLSYDQLDTFSGAIFDFSTLADVQSWLMKNSELPR
jgi:predicted transposase YdaD